MNFKLVRDVVIIVLVLLLLGFAAVIAGKSIQSITPTFTDAERAQIFKVQKDYNAVLPQWQKVSKDAEEVERIMKDKCGSKFHPEFDKDGEPHCIDNPPQSANAGKPQTETKAEKSAKP